MSTRNYSSTVKSAGGGDRLTNREVQQAHRRSFGNLAEAVNDSAGMPGDQIPYHDPLGALSPRGEPIDLKSKLYEKYKPAFAKFNELQRKGYSVEESTRQVAKEIGSSAFSLPVFFTPETHRTDVRDVPMADMIPRVAVAENTVKVDELTDVAEADSFNEPGSAGGTDENWPENDDSYSKHEYEVEAYGRRNKVTDYVQLSANTLRSTRALTEENQVAAIRHYEEDQILEGTGADGDSFDGIYDHADADGKVTDADSTDGSDPITVDDVRDNLEYLRREGASYGDIVHVTDHKAFNDLKSDLETEVRYGGETDELDFGFRALDIDGTPVLESHGAPYTDDGRKLYSFDMGSHYMAMLQDVTMHPLARDSPQEEFATDAYGTLVSEAPSRTAVVENLA